MKILHIFIFPLWLGLETCCVPALSFWFYLEVSSVLTCWPVWQLFHLLMSLFFQLHSISKTVATTETPPKEKYVRSILFFPLHRSVHRQLCEQRLWKTSPTCCFMLHFVHQCSEVSLTAVQTSSWVHIRRVEPPPSGPTSWTCLCPATPWSAGSSAICCTKFSGTDTEMWVWLCILWISLVFVFVCCLCDLIGLCLTCRLSETLTDTAATLKTWVSSGWVTEKYQIKTLLQVKVLHSLLHISD